MSCSVRSVTSLAIGDTTESYGRDGDGYDVHGNMLHMPHLPELHWNFMDQLQLSRRALNGGAPGTSTTGRVRSHAGEHDPPQGMVGQPVAARVEPMAGDFP